MTVGQRIAKCRKNKNMSQEELAERLGISRQAVSKWENDLATPDTYNMIQLSKVLDEDVEYLACGNESAIVLPAPVAVKENTPEPPEEDDEEEEERHKTRKFWGFVLFIWGLTSIVRFFNPGLEFNSEEWWAKAIVFMIISIPCIFGLKLLFEKKRS
jgi:transcriptional regulator with XRE-family HTH domain